MTLADRNLAKQNGFERLLQGGVVALHLDARHPGVQVPPRFASDPWLVLNFSWRYNLPDFTFDARQVEGSLSFGGRPFFCVIPWPAVFAMSNEARTEGEQWLEDMPEVPALPPSQDQRSTRHEGDDPLPEPSTTGPTRTITASPMRHLPARRFSARPRGTDGNSPTKPVTATAAPGGLQVIDGGRSDPQTEDPDPPAPRPVSHLRRVK